MGYDLYNANGEYLRFNIYGWPDFLQRVHGLGWQPMGKVQPDWSPEEWADTASDSQLITKGDCESIARVIRQETMQGNEIYPALSKAKAEIKSQLMNSGIDKNVVMEIMPLLFFEGAIEKTNDNLNRFFSNGPVRIY